MDSFTWRKKRDKYRDEMDEDEIEARDVKLIDTLQDPQFVMRDEHNAEAMKKLKIKWW